jgi:hypothetical protein
MTFHRHHVKPRSFGGDERLCNLWLLHPECHQELHTTFSREDMARLTELGIDYAHTQEKVSPLMTWRAGYLETGTSSSERAVGW